MAKQVTFYSVETLPPSSNILDTGVYFVNNGELYKGARRFGLGRVTVASSTSGVTDAARGDIVVTGSGAGWVFDGNNWQSIGGDIETITSDWQADISTWVSGLVQSGTGSYITGITQDADGKVTASASNFATDVKNAIGDGDVSGTGNGITVSVVTTSGVVTSVQVEAANITATSVSATTGTFTNLTVTDTATFSATTVSATSLTVNGSTVEQIADDRISNVTTTTVGASSVAVNTKLPTELAVRNAIDAAVSNLAGAMHFRGTATITKSGETITVSNFSETFTPAGGDVVVDTANNLEAVYTGSAWELLGSNSVYALDAYAPGTETVTAAATTLGGAVHAIASAVDTLTTKVSTLESAVTGGSSSSTVNGVSVEVVTASTTAAPTVSLTGVGTAASKNYTDTVTDSGTSLPTESAVYSAISNALAWLDATGTPIS